MPRPSPPSPPSPVPLQRPTHWLARAPTHTHHTVSLAGTSSCPWFPSSSCTPSATWACAARWRSPWYGAGGCAAWASCSCAWVSCSCACPGRPGVEMMGLRGALAFALVWSWWVCGLGVLHLCRGVVQLCSGCISWSTKCGADGPARRAGVRPGVELVNALSVFRQACHVCPAWLMVHVRMQGHGRARRLPLHPPAAPKHALPPRPLRFLILYRVIATDSRRKTVSERACLQGLVLPVRG